MKVAMDKCHKVSQPSKLTAETLKKLLPGCSSTSKPSLGKRKFDPCTECIVSGQKKKSSNTRGKPRTIPVVLLKGKSRFVPRGYARSKLNKAGRIVKVDFRRNMNSLEVRDAIMRAFPAFENAEQAQFVRCGQDNRLWVCKEQDLDGDGVFEVCGQGSLYLTQEHVEV
ncbi:MAG: hypothetical protein OXU61_11790 [Gammaproteobacteria bacterium]|nr:hypothetical protein [Gammaproteobacteria bacterium]